MKPYQTIPIEECGEPMVALPEGLFILQEPHMYVKLGAPYGSTSPWFLRKRVLEALMLAQGRLTLQNPGWKILITDAYRPNAVQAFMVEGEFSVQAHILGIEWSQFGSSAELQKKDKALYEKAAERVWRLWSPPSEDPAKPPPHSTGAALDCTLVDAEGREVNMGSPVDENSDRSYPDYFANATTEPQKQAHENRTLLNDIMKAEGLRRNPWEWWHFSIGDQLWAYIERSSSPAKAEIIARYGSAERLFSGS